MLNKSKLAYRIYVILIANKELIKKWYIIYVIFIIQLHWPYPLSSNAMHWISSDAWNDLRSSSNNLFLR
jgi:hypothetical protein